MVIALLLFVITLIRTLKDALINFVPEDKDLHATFDI